MKNLKYIGTYLILPFIYGLSCLPHFILYRISDFMYFFFYHVLKYRLSVIYNNLKNSFPEKSHEELIKIQKEFYKNLMDIMVETVKEFTLTKKQVKKRFRFTNPEIFQQQSNRGKSVMMLMGHFNNWEYAVSTALWVPQDCWAVYGKLNNPVMDKYLVRTREKYGFTLFPMEKTYDVMLQHEQGNKLYMFMADQSPHHGSIKYWLQFLNQETGVHIGAEKLSKMLDLAVIYIDIQKVKRGFYEITAKTLFEEASQTKEHEITDKYFSTLEDAIRKNPAQWLWSHKRWKYKRGIKY